MKIRGPQYALEYVTNPARWRRRTSLPTHLNLPITDNCNSRCVMCDVWKSRSSGEITAAELREILRDRLFVRLQHVGISGGEPTLRADLVEIVQAIVETVPKLKSLSVTTHGFLPRRWEKILKPIEASCRAAGVRLRLNISVDGTAEFHDRVRQIPRGHEKCLETRHLARRLGVDVEFQATVSSVNVYNVGAMAHQAIEQDVAPIFRQATVIDRLDNRESMADVALAPAERSFLADFLRSAGLSAITKNPARRLFYRDLSHRLISGAPRRAPCYFQREGVLLSAQGDLFHCSISTEPIGNVRGRSAYDLYFSEPAEKIRHRVLTSLCASCMHDQAGAWSPLALMAETWRRSTLGRGAHFGARVVRFVSAAFVERVRALLVVTRPGGPTRCERAAVIGAYGGEHVGDAAILGGVLLRLHAQYGTRAVVILSTRPDRTRTWVDGLRLPVHVDIADYDSQATRVVSASDALVYAGGPIMDLPELMVRHLRTATTARALGRRVLIEGVGIGPFRSRIVKTLAGALLRSADTVSCRSTAAAQDELVSGRPVTVVADPAFDYLASRLPSSDAVRQSARAAIMEATRSHPDALRIGVNLRPLWSKYAGSGVDIAELEARTVETVASALAMTGRGTGRPIHAVFFPMNADVYGFSDLALGHSLARRISPEVTLRICEHELLVDEVLCLLKRLDLVMAMRLHAAIFSLAADVPTIGIDYRVGRPGKVTELFVERGLARQVRRIDILDADWLAGQLVDSSRVAVAADRQR